VEIKGQLNATDWFFTANLTVRSTCFEHHYAHHQELKIYTNGCWLWYLALWFAGRWSGVKLWVMCPVAGCANLQTKAPSTIGSNHLYKS